MVSGQGKLTADTAQQMLRWRLGGCMPEYVMMALMKLGASKAFASALVNFAISATLNAAALLFSRTSGADASRELSVPNTLPP